MPKNRTTLTPTNPPVSAPTIIEPSAIAKALAQEQTATPTPCKDETKPAAEESSRYTGACKVKRARTAAPLTDEALMELWGHEILRLPPKVQATRTVLASLTGPRGRPGGPDPESLYTSPLTRSNPVRAVAPPV